MSLIRRVLLALLLSLLVGFVIGTVLRLRLERPVRYIGRVLGEELAIPALPSALASHPLHVRHVGAAILDAGHHEEQVG